MENKPEDTPGGLRQAWLRKRRGRPRAGGARPDG